MSMNLYVGCKATVSVLCTSYRNGISGKSGVIRHVWSSRRSDGIAGADQEVWPENYDIYGISIYGMKNPRRYDGCFIVSGKDLVPQMSHDEDAASDSAQALKIAANSVYGRASCNDDCEETDMWTKANPNLGIVARWSIRPEKIIFNGPKTIVLWTDGSKTIVSCKAEEQFDPYAGFCAALAKKMYGSTSRIKKILETKSVVHDGAPKVKQTSSLSTFASAVENAKAIIMDCIKPKN